jgi:hypothetical protein
MAHDVLPASLKAFTLYIYDNRSVNWWAPDLLGLSEMKASRFPELREIQIGYWTYGGGFVVLRTRKAIEAVVVQVEG